MPQKKTFEIIGLAKPNAIKIKAIGNQAKRASKIPINKYFIFISAPKC